MPRSRSTQITERQHYVPRSYLARFTDRTDLRGSVTPLATAAPRKLAKAVQVRVFSDVQAALLLVNGQARGPLQTSEPRTLELRPGAYRFEAQSNGNIVAVEGVTVQPGLPLDVHLRAPGSQLSVEQLSNVVVNGRKDLQRCYEQALRTANSNEIVRLDVDIQITSPGNVTSVHTTGKALPGLEDCIARTIRAWRFPTSGGSTQTHLPLVFTPGV